MIPIEKLTHAHIGRKVVTPGGGIEIIDAFSDDLIRVKTSNGPVFWHRPNLVEFYDYPGGLTRDDIGSRWMHEIGTEFTFKGADFTQDGEELLIFASDTDKDHRRWMRANNFSKSFTRIPEQPEQGPEEEKPKDLYLVVIARMTLEAGDQPTPVSSVVNDDTLNKILELL